MKLMDYDMTREEAIEFLEHVKYVLLHSNSWLTSTHNPIEQSFDMAIKALQHQRQDVDICEKCWRKFMAYVKENGTE